MKKKLFSIMAIAAIAMTTSCKKEEALDSNQLGEATINGNVFAYIDGRNDVDANGLFIDELTPENLEGLAVSVSINTMIWDQSPDNNYDYPVKTYTTTTDADGNYTLTIPATDEPNNVTIVFGDMLATYWEYTADGSDASKEIEIDGGSQNVSIFNGASLNVRHEAGWNNVSGTAETFGSATLRVVYRANWDQTNGTTNDTLTGTALIGQTVTATYNNGPNDLSGNVYSAVIAVDANDPTQAIAEFTIPTYAAGNTNVSRMYFQTPDFQGTRLYNDGTDDITQNCIWDFSNNNYYDGQNLFNGTIATRTLNYWEFSYTDN
jgi:hypothetical protein